MISGQKPQEYYRDQYGIHPVFGGWFAIEDPPTGFIASKTSGWVADQFTPDGLTIDFSSVVPTGTRAVRVYLELAAAASVVWYRKYNDANISNTPWASSETSHRLVMGLSGAASQVVLWLDIDCKTQLAVYSTDQDLYISYPDSYLV